MIDHRIAICAACSLAAHVVISLALDELPPYAATTPPPRVAVQLVAAPPPPPPPPPPPAPEPPPEPVVREQPRPRPPQPVVRDTPPPVAAETPPEPLPTQGNPDAKPKFGVSMESTSQGGSTSVPVGNTTRADAPRGAPGDPVEPRAAPAAAAEVTKMPLPQGRCAGAYTDAARDAAIEGVVVLDVVVDETGKTRDITVVEGLPHGLTEAAIAALRACRFTPGEKAGVAVPVRIRGFKIRFVLDAGG